MYINPEQPLGRQSQPIRRALSAIGAAATEDDLEKFGSSSDCGLRGSRMAKASRHTAQATASSSNAVIHTAKWVAAGSLTQPFSWTRTIPHQLSGPSETNKNQKTGTNK